MILAYLAFPYSRNPKKNTEEVRKIAKKLVKKYPELLILVPHFCFNWAKRDAEDIEKQTTNEHLQAISWELEAISRSDCFIIGKPLDYSESYGTSWEFCYARSLNKPIFEASDLLKKKINLSKEVKKND